MRRILGALVRVDWVLILVPILLVGVGLTMVYTLALAQGRLDLFWSQLTYAGFAVVVFTGATIVDYRAMRQASALIYAISILLLALVFVVGRTSFGATRWIDVGPFQLQPAELMKAALTLTLAAVLADHVGRVSWPRYALCLGLALAPVLLVLFQPDLGSSSVLIVIAASALIASRLSVRQLGASATLAVVALVAGWLSLRDYQRERLEVFLNRSRDPQGASYNVRQSIIAVGSGGLTGQGIGRGSQSQLNFLPVAHTDFMFATVAEATGFLGAMTLLGLYALLTWRCFRLAETLTDPFAMFVALAVGAMLLVQVLVNAGMNIGLLPVTGIPLPFVSHGGSSLLVVAYLVGTLEGMYLRRKKIAFGT